MRKVFLLALSCAALSLLALLGMSAMTVAPGSSAEASIPFLRTILLVFLFTWFAVAWWAGLRTSASIAPRSWAPQLLLIAGIVYLLLVTVLIIG